VKFVWAAEQTANQDTALAHCLLSSIGSTNNTQVQPALGTTPDVSEAGVVIYKGRVLNIAQEFQQHKQVEQERILALLKTEELEIQLKSTKEGKDYLEKKKHRLESDLDRYKKKLHETERSLKLSQEDASQVKSTLQSCKRYGERVVDLVNKAMPKKEEKKPSDKKDKPTDPNGGSNKSEENATTTETNGEEKPAENTNEDEEMPDSNQGDLVLAEEVIAEGNGSDGKTQAEGQDETV